MTVDSKSKPREGNNPSFPFAEASTGRDKFSTPLAKPRNLDKFGSKSQGMRGLAFGLCMPGRRGESAWQGIVVSFAWNWHTTILVLVPSHYLTEILGSTS